MEACLEALLEMDFCSKPPIFGVEVHMKAPAGDALSPTLSVFFESIKNLIFSSENNKDSHFNSLPVSRTGKCWRLHKFCGSTGIDVEGEHHHLLSWQPYGLIS
jgi:hypothetical protein